MQNTPIQNGLVHAYDEFLASLLPLTAEQFESAPAGKWTPGQQLAHIYISVKALKPAFKMPKLLLRQQFGLANRPSRSYDEVVARYQERLAEGGKAPAKYAPDPVSLADRTVLSTKVRDTVAHLTTKMAKWSEADLDKYILPHPLLGKVTVREMMMFTIYHVQHHQEIIQGYIASNPAS